MTIPMNMTERAARAEAQAERLAAAVHALMGPERGESVYFEDMKEARAAYDAWTAHRADLDTLALNGITPAALQAVAVFRDQPVHVVALQAVVAFLDQAVQHTGTDSPGVCGILRADAKAARDCARAALNGGAA